jgi:hypothetical protein
MATRKKIVFICGPYSGNTGEEIEANIREAAKYAVALAEHDIGFICPHLNTYRFETKCSAPYQFYLDMDLVLLERGSDATLAMPQLETSNGARGEVARSQRLGRPIFYPQSPEDEQTFALIVRWARGEA